MAAKNTGKLIALRDIFIEGKPFAQGEEVKGVDDEQVKLAVSARRVADEKSDAAIEAAAEAKAKAEAKRKAEVKTAPEKPSTDGPDKA